MTLLQNPYFSDLSLSDEILGMNHTQIFWKNWKIFNINLRHPKNWCVWGEYWVSQQRTAAARGKKLPGACHLSCKKAPLYHQKLPQKYCLRNSFESKVSILKISLNEKPFKWGSNVVDIICLLGWFNWSAKKGGGPLMLMALWGCLGRVNWIPPILFL